MLVAIFFTFTIAAYWIFDKERAQEALAGLAKPGKRKSIVETWDLIDAKLGGYVRGSLLMVAFVSTVLSFAFWLIGVPFWLLIGVFAGIVELVPVIGPLAAGLVAIGAGLTVSWQTARGGRDRRLRPAAAPGLRDRAEGARARRRRPPLIILSRLRASASSSAASTCCCRRRLAAVLATLVDVTVFDKDPAKEEVPALIFSERDAEAG